MLTPLRARANEHGVEGPETPEALMISALLHDGMFTPEKFGLTEDHLSVWVKLWRFCIEYQAAEGKAPPLELVKAKFPDFELTVVGARYAADQLHKAAASRDLRTRARTLLKALDDEDMDTAFESMRGLEPPRTMSKPAVDIWHQSEEPEFEVSKIPFPFVTLGRATGGLAPGEVMYLGGGPGIGKTWMGCHYVGAAMEAGYEIRYLSLEMPARRIVERVRRSIAARLDKRLLKQLDSSDWHEQKKAVDELRERVPGTLHVIDPSHGRGTNAAIRAQQAEGDLVVVDHVGLLYTPEGHRAIHDWRAQAWISNQIKEDALAHGTPILGLSQLNREAENSSSKAPTLDKVGGSYALVQDADIFVTMKRLTKRVMIHGAEKVREGEGVSWYSEFLPARASFKEVSRDQAIELQAMDEDRDAAQ